MNELISIIIPVYNAEPYLEECLLSIQNQTYKNLEIILIDDGSSDKSGMICDKFSEKDNRFKVIHQKNSGVAYARNVGLKEAAGKYLGFVDSDDYIEPEMFERMYKAAYSSGAFIVLCGYKEFGKRNQIFTMADAEINRDDAVKELVRDNYIKSHLWNKLFIKELFNEITFPDGKIYEDVSIIHLLFMKTNILKIISPCLYNYRIRTASITDTSLNGEKSKALVDALEKRCIDLRDTLFYRDARYTQVKEIRRIMIDLIGRKKTKSDYYKGLYRDLDKIMVDEKDLFKKRDILKTKMLLRFPALYVGISRSKRYLTERNFGE